MAPTKTTKTACATKQTASQKHKTAATQTYDQKAQVLLDFVKTDAFRKKAQGSQRKKPRADREILSRCMDVPMSVFMDKEVTEITCSVCAKPIKKDTSEIKRHLCSHLPHSEKPHVCDHDGCGYSTVQRRNLADHIKRAHENARFICGHEYVDNGETYICNFRTSAHSRMYEHWRGYLHPRHADDPAAEFWKCAPIPASTTSPATSQPATSQPSTAMFVREQAPSPSSSSCASRSPSSSSSSYASRSPTPFVGSTATSLTSINTPVVSLEELTPAHTWPYSAAYDGGLTGSFSLHPRDFKTFLYGRRG